MHHILSVRRSSDVLVLGMLALSCNYMSSSQFATNRMLIKSYSMLYLLGLCSNDDKTPCNNTLGEGEVEILTSMWMNAFGRCRFLSLKTADELR